MCQITNNREWKKNRNLHAICLLDMVLNNHFEAPYNKFAPESPVPIISKSIVKARLSSKFAEVVSVNNDNNEIKQNIKNSNNINKSVSEKSIVSAKKASTKDQ